MTSDLKDWYHQGSYFKHREHRIFYRMNGEGETLLLVHGFPTASWDWHKIYDDLCEKFRVLAPDMIGFGFSAKPKKYLYSIHDQADLLETLLELEGVERVHLLCHDYGNSVGQELLARFVERSERDSTPYQIMSICFLNGGLFPESHKPRLIQKLLLSPIGPLLNPFLTKAKLRSNLRAVFGKDTPPTETEVDEFYDLIDYNNGRAVMNKLIRYMTDRKEHRERWVRPLVKPPVPVRLIDGWQDPVSGKHLVDRYKQMVEAPDVVDLEDIGHYPQTEAPDRVLEHFMSFQNSLSS